MTTALLATLVISQSVTRTLSVYGDEFIGRKMANGERFYQHLHTCATNDWKLGTKLRITHNGRSVVLTVSDRMAKRFSGKRIDLPRDRWRELEQKPDGLHRGAKVEVVK